MVKVLFLATFEESHLESTVEVLWEGPEQFRLLGGQLRLVLQEKEVLTETSLGAIRIFSKEIA